MRIVDKKNISMVELASLKDGKLVNGGGASGRAAESCP